jgi:hypothetical protein
MLVESIREVGAFYACGFPLFHEEELVTSLELDHGATLDNSSGNVSGRGI